PVLLLARDRLLQRADLVLVGDEQRHVAARAGGLVLDLADALALGRGRVLDLLDADAQVLGALLELGRLGDPLVDLSATDAAFRGKALQLRLRAEDFPVDLLEVKERMEDCLHLGRDRDAAVYRGDTAG